MQRLVTTLAFFFIYINSFTQQFGGTPPSQKWRQINTDSVRVIFPAGLDSQANRVASVVHWMASHKPVAIGEQLKKIDIVLQHQTTVSNAYVGLGPFRSEFQLTPDPFNFEPGSLSWIDLLSVHEYRHVQQMNNFRYGISKAMRVLFGEEGYALAINAAVPDWFFEGDAVYMETFLSNQGRGRLSLFTNSYPSLWKSEKKYKWMKLRNGSLKDYVPNHYNLGYLLVNYGYEKYGEDFWAKVTRDASAYKSLFYPFQAAIKRHAGVDYEKFRKDANEHYQNRFDVIEKATERKMVAQPREILPVQKKYVTSYYYPFNADDNSVVYLKRSYRHLPAFYRKDSSGEHKLKLRDISIDNHFSYRNGKIVYAAHHTDARWGWRDYSVIQMLDVNTGEQREITKKSKYFAPDISPNGEQIAAVQQNINGKSELHILHSASGELKKSIQSSDISLFTDPRFIDDSSLVTAVRLHDGKMALAIAEIETGNTMRLTTPSFNVVGNPSVDNGIVFFTASFEGNDDVFALRLSDKKTLRITQGPLGNYFPSAGYGKLTWSVFTAEGYQLRQINLSDIIWDEKSTDNLEMLKAKFAPAITTSQENLVENISTRIFQTREYSKSTGLFNFHSWRPNYDDPVFSFSIYGQNVLNTLQTELYYLYHSDEQTHAVGFSTAFSQLFPYIILGSEYTFGRQSFLGNRLRNWDQLDSRIGLQVPIRSTSGKTFKNFNIGTNYVLRNEFNKGFFKDSIGNTSFSYLLHTINWTQQLPRALQHIYPKWAYSLTGNYRHAIGYYDGFQLYGAASVYVPGIMASHNLILSGAFQQRDTSRLLFSTRMAGARGYAEYYGTNVGSRLTRLSADYHFPIVYPDWGFANILYLQRLRGDIFYDHQTTFTNVKKKFAELRSVGAEVYIDTKWWNQYPLTFGVRVSRLLNNDPLAKTGKGEMVYEFLLPVSIIPR